ncbi:MAG TPA: tetratricopeptide repeat protein [Humisphaera sp.]|jgi:tetratricopeptide (TPR) repeat protein|nr:tetratricopeptide repeat protein [Humisphaera sp.]
MSDSVSERWEQIRSSPDTPATRLQLLRRFLEEFPEFGTAWHSLGFELTDISRFDEAEAALRKALSLKTQGHYFVMTDLGQLFRRKGDFATARQCFDRAIEYKPDDAHAYIYCGGMLARLGEFAEAEAMHRRATQCSDGCIDEAHHNLGLVLRAVERYPEALECFKRALEIDPYYDDAKEAMEDVERVISMRSDT